MPTPYQSIGSRGVNHLAAKLSLSLLPPSAPFFRLPITDQTSEELTGDPNLKSKIEEALAGIERTVMHEVDTSTIRAKASEVFKQLIVAGNVLAYLPDEGGMRVFRLDRYVCRRDPSGNVLEIITKEDIAIDALPDQIREAIEDADGDEAHNGVSEKTVSLFTRTYRAEGKWQTYQEVAGKIVPDSQGTYPIDKSPYIALRFTAVDGEDYGRSYIEDYIGDLRSIEGLSQAILEGSAASAKVLFLVKTNGMTNQKTLAEAPNGAIRAGDANDVSCVQVGKHADLSVAQASAKEIEQRLSFAFLLQTAIQRSGERVTAEEVRYMASELEDALGGVYSLLSQEFQLPLVHRLMYQLERQGKLPVLPKGTVRPAITTGLEALGRGHDLNRLTSMFGVIAPLGAETLNTYLNVSDYIARVATSLGIDPKGLIRSDEEVAAQQQQQQMAAMMQQMGPQVAGKGMDIARDQMKPGTPPQ